jgi:hypothetical protein
MFGRLQHYYVNHIGTLLCLSHCNITMFVTLGHYYVCHIATLLCSSDCNVWFCSLDCNIRLCFSHDKVGLCSTHYKNEVMAKFSYHGIFFLYIIFSYFIMK